MANRLFAIATVLLVAVFAAAQNTTPNARPRASDLGLKVGILPTGPLDAITDVAGVEVGQTTNNGQRTYGRGSANRENGGYT